MSIRRPSLACLFLLTALGACNATDVDDGERSDELGECGDGEVWGDGECPDADGDGVCDPAPPKPTPPPSCCLDGDGECDGE
jgi:hypothetical protein